MQIVIDIDDNLYTRLFDNGVDNYDDAVDMAKAIRKGTPISKGLISITDVMSVFDDYMCGEVDEDGMETFLEMLKDKTESEG